MGARPLCPSVVPKKLHFTSCWTRTGSPRNSLHISPPPKWCVPACRIKHTATPTTLPTTPSLQSLHTLAVQTRTHTNTIRDLVCWFNLFAYIQLYFTSAAMVSFSQPLHYPSTLSRVCSKVFGQLGLLPVPVLVLVGIVFSMK